MEEVELGPPRSYPIKSLEQLRCRSFFESSFFTFSKSSVPLKIASREKRPRLLACHDLQGGYLDDQWIQGSQNARAYTLTHWRLLDIFVYFSHNLVTLPPPSWTNAAHRHNVQVLGTFITEWSDGANICKELLASQETACMYADRLAELAAALGFDGWLINIENAVAHEHCANLLEFVKQLSESMHALVPESLVIWYDSVTTDGKLAWQDRLNEKNKPFFDVCDGIFTNYTWKKDYPNQSATAAGDRLYDVYMGVDVFGRNTFGGGGYQCDVALKVARDAGVSAALFAQGWSYETNQDQSRWWDIIENCWPAARPDPVQLPFFTDFDIGHGRAKYLDGKQVSDLPWSDLSCQNLQPLLHVAESRQHQLVVSTSEESAVYSGGVCIKAVGDVGHDEVCIMQLYHTDAIIEEASLHVSYSVITGNDSSFCLALSVQNNQTGAQVIYFLLDSKEEETDTLARSHQFTHISAVFEHLKRLEFSTTVASNNRDLESVVSGGKLWCVRDFILEWGKYTLTNVFGVCSGALDLQPILIKLLHENESLFDGETFVKQEGRAKQSDFHLDRVESSSAGVEDTPLCKDSNVRCLVQVGHISVASGSHEHFTYSNPTLMGHRPCWLVEDGGNKFVCINFSWKLPRGHNRSATLAPERYHLFGIVSHLEEDLSSPTQYYLGVTMLGCFYVYMFPIPKLPCSLTFELLLQCACGKMQTIGSGTTFTLHVPSQESGIYVKTRPWMSDWLFGQLH